MSDLEAKKEFSERPSQLAADLTRTRGIVRRLPEGVEKQRAELLASQLANGVPDKFINGQMKVMGGQNDR